MTMTPAQSVLGCAILSPEAHPALLSMSDADFERRADKIIFAVLRSMVRDRAHIDGATVAAKLAERGQTQEVGGSAYVFELTSAAPVPVSAPVYAEMARRATRARMYQADAAEMARMLASPEASERLAEILANQRERLSAIPGDLTEADPEAHILETIMNQPDRPTDWLIPGLIERGERIVITGHEGHGKSVVMRQLAACLAAGIHPWTGRTSGIQGCRVLHIDAENSPKQTRAGYRMIERLSGGMPEGWARRITFHARNDGVDLPGRDAGWLHQVAAECSPEAIVIGPAYKLMFGDPQKDRDVLALLSVLDEVRVRHNAALIIEHHSPHGDAKFGPRTVRPYGSSVWLRWPEVGIGLRAHDMESDDLTQADKYIASQWTRPHWLDVQAWRPAREDRDWPGLIKWGGRGDLPWIAEEGYRPMIFEKMTEAA